MARKLDRGKEYGVICGDVEDGSVFDQDGCRFNAEGNLVWAPPGVDVTAEAKAPEPQHPASELDRDDLAMWASGEVKHPWHIVAKSVETIFGHAPKNAADARQMIAVKEAEPAGTDG